MEYVYSPFREMADEMESIVEALAHDVITPEAALEAINRVQARAEYMASRTYGLKPGDTFFFEGPPRRPFEEPIWDYTAT